MSPLTRLGNAAFPIWTRDGTRITLSSGSPGEFRIQSIAADGSGDPEVLLESETLATPEVWAGDEQLVFRREDPEGRLFVLDLAEGGEERPLFEGDFLQHSAAVSLTRAALSGEG